MTPEVLHAEQQIEIDRKLVLAWMNEGGGPHDLRKLISQRRESAVSAAITAHAAHVKEFLEELAEYLGLEGELKPADYIKRAAEIREKVADQAAAVAVAVKQERERAGKLVAAVRQHLIRIVADRDGLAGSTVIATVQHPVPVNEAQMLSDALDAYRAGPEGGRG